MRRLRYSEQLSFLADRSRHCPSPRASLHAVLRRFGELHDRGAAPSNAELAEILSCAPDSVPGASMAGIVVLEGRIMTTMCVSDDSVAVLDDIARESGEGPWLLATPEQPVIIDDLELDLRWPVYRAEVLAGTAVRAVLTLPLFEDNGTAWVLNCYATTPYAFDDDSVEDGLILAACARLAVSALRHAQRLGQALASCEIIGQATGILMERHQLDADTASASLHAMRIDDPGLSVHDVATRIVAGDDR